MKKFERKIFKGKLFEGRKGKEFDDKSLIQKIVKIVEKN